MSHGCLIKCTPTQRLADAPLLLDAMEPKSKHVLEASEINLDVVKFEFNPTDPEQARRLAQRTQTVQLVHALWLQDATQVAWNSSWNSRAETALEHDALLELQRQSTLRTHQTVIANVPDQVGTLPHARVCSSTTTTTDTIAARA